MVDDYWNDQNAQSQFGQQPQPIQPVQPVQPYAQPEASSVGSWVLNLLLAAIPIVGLVMLCVWAFGSTPDASKKNWARANLIWILVAVVIYAILFAVMGVSFMDLYSSGTLS